MGFFDDVVTIVKEVVANPAPVIVGTATGAVVGGSVGGAIAAATGVAEVLGSAEQATAKQAYIQSINEAIEKIKSTKPNYTELAIIWTKINAETFQAAYKEIYGDSCPPPESLAKMIAIDIANRRASLSDEQYQQELDNIHNGTVQASVAQLEHERDNPDKQDQPPSNNDVLNDFFSGVANTVGHWVVDRFKSNFDGADKESGFGAKILRGGVGISWEDIKARGLLGGDNSYLRKIIPTWSDGGGLFGGENSFFRKPFG